MSRVPFQHFAPLEIGRFCPIKANDLLDAAELAYADAQTAVKTALGWGFKEAHLIRNEATSTEVLMLAREDLIVIAPCGTEDLTDALTDVKVRQRPWIYGKAHRGFVESLSSVWESFDDGQHKGKPGIITVLNRWQERSADRPIWLCGHSLGGALALLCGLALRASGWDVVGIYTYGAPAIGDADLCLVGDNFLEDQVERLENNNDPVPKILQALTDSYTTFGRRRYFGEDGNFYAEEPTWFQELWESAKGRVEDFLEPGTDGIKDHKISGGYKEAVRGLLEG